MGLENAPWMGIELKDGSSFLGWKGREPYNFSVPFVTIFGTRNGKNYLFGSRKATNEDKRVFIRFRDKYHVPITEARPTGSGILTIRKNKIRAAMTGITKVFEGSYDEDIVQGIIERFVKQHMPEAGKVPALEQMVIELEDNSVFKNWDQSGRTTKHLECGFIYFEVPVFGDYLFARENYYERAGLIAVVCRGSGLGSGDLSLKAGGTLIVHENMAELKELAIYKKFSRESLTSLLTANLPKYFPDGRFNLESWE